jgi:hypothetical protein
MIAVTALPAGDLLLVIKSKAIKKASHKTGLSNMAGVAGFEPTNDGIKTRCLTAWLYPKIYIVFGCLTIIRKMAGVAGFEPTNDGIKTRCLTAWLYPNTNGAEGETRTLTP